MDFLLKFLTISCIVLSGLIILFVMLQQSANEGLLMSPMSKSAPDISGSQINKIIKVLLITFLTCSVVLARLNYQKHKTKSELMIEKTIKSDKLKKAKIDKKKNVPTE